MSVASQTATDYVVWCSRYPHEMVHLSWPAYRHRHLCLQVVPDNFADLAGLLSPLGYRLRGVVRHRYGFLWLASTRDYIFEREIVWTRHGDRQGHIGERVTPDLADEIPLAVGEYDL